jgi:hypothetical protein
MNFIKKHQINKQKVVEVEKKQVEANTNDIWILREDVKKINNNNNNNNNKLLINDNHRNSKFVFLLTNCNNMRISK